ncbi:MAG TPA: PIG-L family deacetylase [Candidatus Limnocylindrales bacterium]|nr:PIG-L family deacetylase [Candidatus Limnocylindrales bacterium]
MAHVFVAPHPDDVALSCGGLVASLRELGQNVTIITVFSGSGGGNGSLSAYQREALGFGNKTLWPDTEAFNRSDIEADVPASLMIGVGAGPDGSDGDLPPWAATEDRLSATQDDADAAAKRFWQRSSWYRRASIRNQPLAGQALIDTIPTDGAIYTDDVVAAAGAGQAVAKRRVEDERYAYFSEASIVFLDLPDAVFRGYEGDDELLGPIRDGDLSPASVAEILAREITRLEPQNVYFPLAVGNHVDHQLCRDAGIALLNQATRWVMPGPRWAGNVVFYEDFPYAWWRSFESLDDLPAGALAGVPADTLLTPRYADTTEQMEKKIQGIGLYDSQIDRLFGDPKSMMATVRQHAARIAALGGIGGSAERYWHSYQP